MTQDTTDAYNTMYHSLSLEEEEEVKVEVKNHLESILKNPFLEQIRAMEPCIRALIFWQICKRERERKQNSLIDKKCNKKKAGRNDADTKKCRVDATFCFYFSKI